MANIFPEAVCTASVFLAYHTSVSQFVMENNWSKGQSAEGLLVF